MFIELYIFEIHASLCVPCVSSNHCHLIKIRQRKAILLERKNIRGVLSFYF